MRQGSKFRYPHGCSVFDCCSWQKSMAGEAHHLFSLGWDKAQALPQWLSFLVVTAGTFRDWLWSLPALLDLLTTKPPTKVMLSEEQPSRPSELQVLFSQCRKHVDLGRTSSESWLPRCLSGKEFACQFRRHGFYPWVGKIPWSRKWHATPSVFAWEIPWTEEPGKLQSMGLQRVRRDWAHTHLYCRPRCVPRVTVLTFILEQLESQMGARVSSPPSFLSQFPLARKG